MHSLTLIGTGIGSHVSGDHGDESALMILDFAIGHGMRIAGSWFQRYNGRLWSS